MTIPWGVHHICNIYREGTQAEVRIERQGAVYQGWAQAVAIPFPSNVFERVRAAWWVMTGRAEALVWPKPGDLEKALGTQPR